MQQMLADFINYGELKKHLRRVAREYRRRRETLLACLRDAFGEQVTVREPEGGLALWVRFADGVDVDQLVGKALELDLVARSGRQFSPFGHAENALRLGFASLDMDEIRLATQRLAQAAKAIATAVQRNPCGRSPSPLGCAVE